MICELLSRSVQYYDENNVPVLTATITSYENKLGQFELRYKYLKSAHGFFKSNIVIDY